jgi:hypothetical protein
MSIALIHFSQYFLKYKGLLLPNFHQSNLCTMTNRAKLNEKSFKLDLKQSIQAAHGTIYGGGFIKIINFQKGAM